MNIKGFMIMFLMFVVVLIVYDRRQQQQMNDLKRIIELQRYQLYQSQPAGDQPVIVQQAGQPEITINQPASQPAEVIVITQPVTITQPISQPAEAAPSQPAGDQPEISQPVGPAPLPTLQNFGSIAPPAGPGSNGLMAQDITTVAEVYATTKQMLIDFGLWSIGQTAISILVVISFAFIILSWFKA